MAAPSASTLQGLVEASVSTDPGCSDFAVYHCSATRFDGDGRLALVLLRLFGSEASGGSKRQLDIPSSRHVHLATDSDSNALVIVESADKAHIISIRAPTALAVAQWYAVLSTDAGSDILSGLEVRRQTVTNVNYRGSESSESSDEWGFCTADKRPRHFSLDELLHRTAASSTSIDPAQGARQLRRVSSEPEVFIDPTTNDEEDDDDDDSDTLGLDEGMSHATSAATDIVKWPV